MSTHRYTLQKYKTKATRYTCPSCGHKHEFTRYIDNETNQHLADHVGLCNRADSCGYHYPPKLYFIDNPTVSASVPVASYKLINKPVSPPAYIPFDDMAASRTNWEKNAFYNFLLDTFGYEPTSTALAKYTIGTMLHTKWRSGTIFWFVDKRGNVRAGQVKSFDKQGHTKKVSIDCRTFYGTTWYHSVLKEHAETHNEPLPNWLPAYLDNYSKVSCMFGEHLLALEPDMPVAVVEAPKTAIIASMFYPEYVWVAVGAKSYLNPERCSALKGRAVTLFPDLGAYEDWEKRSTLFDGFVKSISMDVTLEEVATEQMREEQADLADYLVLCDLDSFMG